MAPKKEDTWGCGGSHAPHVKSLEGGVFFQPSHNKKHKRYQRLG